MKNNDYYNFIFKTNEDKILKLKLSNAKQYSNESDFSDSIDWILENNILENYYGSATSIQKIEFIHPEDINVNLS
ncbi:MAG: hypothetical protein LBJ93_02085 [Clostridiales bacterium]|jgi:hypothetical protein|nr:hypothetical protein [Clostridiales bacterium]